MKQATSMWPQYCSSNDTTPSRIITVQSSRIIIVNGPNRTPPTPCQSTWNSPQLVSIRFQNNQNGLHGMFERLSWTSLATSNAHAFLCFTWSSNNKSILCPRVASLPSQLAGQFTSQVSQLLEQFLPHTRCSSRCCEKGRIAGLQMMMVITEQWWDVDDPNHGLADGDHNSFTCHWPWIDDLGEKSCGFSSPFLDCWPDR